MRNGQLEAGGDSWRLRFTRSLPHPPEKVWRALTEPEHLDAWFPTTIEGDRQAGAALRFRHRDADLPQIVLAGGPIGGLADLLHCGDKQADQNGNDGDDHQQLDQREASARACCDPGVLPNAGQECKDRKRRNGPWHPAGTRHRAGPR